MRRIISYLWFDGAAEEAAALYAGLIADSRVGSAGLEAAAAA